MGKYSDLFSSAPQTTSKVVPELAELTSAKQSAQYRIGSSPAVASSGKYASLFSNIENIAAGKKQPSRGLWGAIGGGLMKGLEGVGYVLGTPARATASVAKEITDVIEGRGFSPKDLVSQVADKNFYGSSLIKKSGNPWLDSVTGFAVDVLSDPTTYVTFGASAWMGKAGRTALAAKAAEAANIAKAPTLAGKLDEIARLGVHANLTDLERAVLNAPKGVSWTFGKGAGQVIGKEGTTARKISEGVSTAVGKPISKARARIGDLPFLEPVQKVITPKSIRDADLLSLGRSGARSTVGETVERLAGYSASQRGKAMGRSFVAKIGSANQELAKEINGFENSTGLRIAHFIEDETLVPPTPEAQALVGKVKKFLADTRQAGNDVTAEFAGRRGVRAYDIAHRDNYVPHTLSEQARAYLASKRWRGTKYASSIQQTLELNPDEFIKGPAVMRARKLEPGKEWLGETIQTGTIKEINDISERQLGFKWFEDDGATYLNSYIDSVGNQAKRVGFTDRLFDYGVDVVRAIDYKLIPDKEVVGAWHSSVRRWEGMLRGLAQEQGKSASQSASIMRKANNLARQVVQDNNTKLLFSQKEIETLGKQLAQAQYFLDVASERAAARGGALQQQFESTVAPFRARLQAMSEALSTNDQLEMAATMYLEEAHARMFPRMKKRPTNPKIMAEQILAKSDSRTTSRVKALETRVARLKRSLGPRGKISKGIKQSEAEIKNIKDDIALYTSEIDNLTGVITRQTDDFPDGYYVFDESIVDSMLQKDRSAIPQVDFDPGNPNALIFKAPDPRRWVMLDPVEDVESARYFFDNIGRAFQMEMEKFGPESAEQGAMFAAVWKEISEGRGWISLWGMDNTELEFLFEYAGRYKEYLDEAAAEGIDDVWEEQFKVFSIVATESLSAFFAKAQNEGLNLADFMDDPVAVAQQIFVNTAEVASLKGDFAKAGGKRVAGVYLPEELYEFMDTSYYRAYNIESGYGPFGSAQQVLTGDQSGLLQPWNKANIFPDEDVIYQLSENSFFSDDGERLLSLTSDFVRKTVDSSSPDFSMIEDTRDPFFRAVESMSTFGTSPFEEYAEMSQNLEFTRGLLPAAEAELGGLYLQKVGREAEIKSATSEKGGVISAAKRLKEKVGKATEDIRRSTEGIEVPDGQGGTRVMKRDEVAQQMGLDARKINRAEKKLAKEIENDPLTKEARAAGRTYNKVESSFNNAKALRGEAGDWEQTYGVAYREDVMELDRLLAERPPKGASAEVNREWFDQVERVYSQIRNPQIFTEPQRNALERIFVQKRGQETQIAILEQYVDFGKAMLDQAQSGKLGGRMVQDIKEGWGAIESLGVQMPDELRNLMFGRIENLSDPKEFNKYLDMYFRYQRFFKVTAMLTPGFIVRNAMTAAFNNYVAGVTTRETAEAIKFSQNALKHGPAKAIEMAPAAERKLYEEAYNVVMATGAGQTADDFFYPIASEKGQRWLNSRVVTAWRNRNEQVEMAGRMALALSSLRKNLGFDGAVSQVARYHFDYTDLSKLDEVAKRFVPFWTFATKNIPLQIINQIARPGLYRAYDSLERNFEVDKDLVLPPWMQANRPISGPGGRIFMPDLPFIDMENQLRMFGDPMRFASQLNPLLKLPVELAGGRQLGLDIPFSEKPYQVRGPLDYPAALGGALFGQTQQTAEGDLVTSSQAGYALPSLLPSLAQLQRLIPQLGGKETYVERQPYSILSATTGIPLRGVTETEQQNELIRRQFALRDFLSNLTRMGYLEPKE